MYNSAKENKGRQDERRRRRKGEKETERAEHQSKPVCHRPAEEVAWSPAEYSTGKMGRPSKRGEDAK
jgi:hypothetical protein